MCTLTRREYARHIASDLQSETFVKALERRRQFRGGTPEQEQGWLFSIARSELRHHWRDRCVERRALARLGVARDALSDPAIERVEEVAGLRVADALAALPAEQRRAVELRVIGEHPYADAAVRLGVSEQAARARVSRGLRALARRLGELDARRARPAPGQRSSSTAASAR